MFINSLLERKLACQIKFFVMQSCAEKLLLLVDIKLRNYCRASKSSWTGLRVDSDFLRVFILKVEGAKGDYFRYISACAAKAKTSRDKGRKLFEGGIWWHIVKKGRLESLVPTSSTA